MLYPRDLGFSFIEPIIIMYRTLCKEWAYHGEQQRNGPVLLEQDENITEISLKHMHTFIIISYNKMYKAKKTLKDRRNLI